jgi:hypothetical protein
MGKSKSSQSPAPFQPTAPQSSWGNTMNYAPTSGYTRAGQGIAGVDMNAIQQRIMQQRQQAPQMATQTAPQPTYAQRDQDRQVMRMQGAQSRGLTENPYRKMGYDSARFVPGQDINEALRRGDITHQQAMFMMRQNEK